MLSPRLIFQNDSEYGGKAGIGDVSQWKGDKQQLISMFYLNHGGPQVLVKSS